MENCPGPPSLKGYVLGVFPLVIIGAFVI